MGNRLRFQKELKTEQELRDIVGFPNELVRNKSISFLDHNCINFITKSPFLIISSADEYGNCDASPKGDQRGFVHVLDEKHLVIPERQGNKRMDTMRNILTNPQIGLLFLIPGLEETLRVNGKATLVRDDDILEKMIIKGKKPLLGIVVEIQECFIHCAKAFKRSELWSPDTWEDKETLPYAAQIIFEHAKLPNTSVESIKKGLEESYTKRLY
ncbi:pyridoxamine 5'-phosphate oxidase family protein [Fredinandcohnia sp. 179-A 10B2 NHS]|uniref:pyridoxamine 5'-phosphate oxidase family protein n=1 Tax=Fredinandcohnia sp. 179-A 10B2 NHS TaxID=3235176 RepID=UPI0039A344F4